MPSVEKESEGEIIGRDSIDGCEPKLTKLKGENVNGCVLNREKGDKTNAGAQTSPKNRRKIRQPKQYIPKPRDAKESNGTHGDSQEPLVSPVGTLNQGSIVREESHQDNSVSQQDEVHVLTASQGNGLKTNPTPKRGHGSQKAKRPGNTGVTTRKKNSNNPVPKKPEDLIKEAMASGRPSVQATKRDAQYRKSYAYKIWKEKADCEVQSESTNPKPGTKRNAPYPQVSPSQQNNPGRAAYYWPPNQYNGTSKTGFYANGKYYEINPSVLYGVHNGSKVPPTTTKLSPTVTTSAIQSCAPVIVPAGGHKTTPPPASDEAHPRGSNTGGEKVAIKGGRQRKIVKTGPPNIVVIPQHPETIQENRVSPAAANSPSPPVAVTKSYPQSSSRSPGHEIPSPVPQPSTTQNSLVKTPKETTADPSPKAEMTQNDSEVKDPSEETPTSSPSTGPSNIVTLMKTTLTRKHSKENVQPLAISFKANLRTKRKLEEDDPEETSTKKSAKPTIFTPLNEQEAEKLANDIYDVNLEYFPFQTLAEKAAQSTEHAQGDKTDEGTKVKDIERVRCLLKDFYDVTYSCSEDPDMEKFDTASRKFGRKNILNHLSLLDRYFAELQRKVASSN